MHVYSLVGMNTSNLLEPDPRASKPAHRLYTFNLQIKTVITPPPTIRTIYVASLQSNIFVASLIRDHVAKLSFHY
jgi:hypothetical protein